MLLGATLLPVADIFSSEDLETSFSCPNESETTDKGDLTVIPNHSLLRQRDGGYFHHPGITCAKYGVDCGVRNAGVRIRQLTLWSKKLLKIAPCDASVAIPIPFKKMCCY